MRRRDRSEFVSDPHRLPKCLKEVLLFLLEAVANRQGGGQDGIAENAQPARAGDLQRLDGLIRDALKALGEGLGDLGRSAAHPGQWPRGC